MGYLGVNIWDNVVLTSNTGFDDEGYFQIGFSTKVDTGNMFAAFDGGAALQADTNDIKIFKPNMVDYDKNPKDSASIGQDLINFKNVLVDILSVHMPIDKAQGMLAAPVMFQGLGITAETQGQLNQKLVDEGFVTAVFNNLAKAFTTATQPFIGQNPFRVKFRRTSKAKHFATIPPKGRFPEVWIEPMTIPKEASQIKWSDWEVKNGYNDGTKVEADVPSEETTEKVENMFAAPTTDAAAPSPTGPGAGGGEFSQAEQPAVNPFNQ